MTGFFQVARREIAERKSLLVAGLALGVVPLLTPLLPGVREGASEVRQITMLILLFAFAWGAAVMLGGSVWARDLSERRLGFYFSRPVSPAALFGGKLAAAFALVLASSALLLLPGMLGGGLHGKWLAGGGNSAVATLVVAGSLALLPIAHAGATVIRARDPWSALHLPLVVLLAVIVAWSGATITRAAFGPTSLLYVLGFALLVPVILAAAGFAQASSGRTDAFRSHRALAIAAWAPLLGLALLGALGAAWYAHPTPPSLARIDYAWSTPDGRYAFLLGEGAGLRKGAEWGFLVDARDPDRFVRTGGRIDWAPGGAVSCSRDGGTAAWLAVDRSGERIWKVEPDTFELRIARLTDTGIVTEDTGLTTRIERPFGFALSPRGTRVATIDGKTVSVVDLATRRTLAAANANGIRGRLVPAFADEDRLVLTESWGPDERQAATRDLAILELDVSARRLVRTGTVTVGSTNWARTLSDAISDRMLVFAKDLPVSLRDGRTGAFVASLGEKGWSGTFLSDGRVALATRAGSRWALHLYSHDGVPVREIDLGAARWVTIGSQSGPNMLVLGIQRSDDWSRRDSVVLDLDSGKVVRQLPGLTPLGGVDWTTSVAPQSPPRSEALFVSGDKSLVSVDLTTGARRVLLPR